MSIEFIDLSPKYERRLPKIGDILPIFDDGKINPSRLEVGTIIDVVPYEEALDMEFEMIDFEYDEIYNEVKFVTAPLRVAWERGRKEAYWLFDETSDYFIIAKKEYDYEPIEVFARRNNGGWFSIPLKSYMTGATLDSDMTLFNAWEGDEYRGGVYNEYKDKFLIQHE